MGVIQRFCLIHLPGIAFIPAPTVNNNSAKGFVFEHPQSI
jgi:hypothetical protein